MSQVFDYIEWRGDIHMTQDPVNDVDLLILCRLAYIPFGTVVSKTWGQEPVTLGQAAAALLAETNADARQFRKKEDRKLLEMVLDSPRFNTIRLSAFADEFSEDREEQFSAITMELEDDTIAVVYRGTDGTLVGWKEDFNMSFSSETPAQRDAIVYLEGVAHHFTTGKLRVAGHSKGGNLSLYAATFCQPAVQRRIVAVRNFDGPGFNEYQSGTPDFSRIADVTLTYLPDSSIIGMLLESMGKSVIVESERMGLFQHNLYLWKIRRAGFITRDEVRTSSQRIDHTLTDWLNSLTPEQRERMIDGVFQILKSSDAKTLRELWTGKNGWALLSKAVQLDPETRHTISQGFQYLKQAMTNQLHAEPLVDKVIAQS